MSSKELVISQNRHETKVAILEDGQLVEMFFQRANEYSLAGSIHKGRVTRVLPGMQSAFVDLGLERDCFLYVSDFFEEHADEFDRVDDRGRDTRGRDRDRSREPREVSPVLALPPVAGAERRAIDFAPAADVPAEEESIAALPLDSTVSAGAPAIGAVEGAGDHRDRRGRRSRRRRRGNHGFPDSKYASPTEESAPPATAEAEAEVEEGPEESTAIEEAPPPAEEFLLLPGESLAKYRRSAQPAPPAPVRAPVESAKAVEAESVTSDDAADEEAEAILDRVDEMEQRAEAAAAQATEREAAPQDAAEDVEAEAEAAPEAKVEAPGEPAMESGSASLKADLPVSDMKADKPSKTPAPQVAAEPAAAVEVEAPTATEEPVAPVAPVVANPEEPAAAEEQPAAVVEPDAAAAPEVVAGASSDETQAIETEIAEGGPIDAEPADLETEPEADQDADPDADKEDADKEEAAASAPPEGSDPSASQRPEGGRLGHRMSRRMRRKARQKPPLQTDVVAEGPAEAAVEPEAPVLETAVPEPERVIDRPERNGRDRDNRGRDRDRDRDRDKDRDKDHDRERPPLPSISDLLKEGQEIIVQIAKEPLGQKGARITSHIALPGRYVVYMPTVEHLGVSRKIGSDDERMRLKKILQKHREGIAGGFIMRTAGEGRTEDEIAADIQYLANLWLDIKQKAEKRRAPLLLHHDVEVVQRLLRDQLTDGFKAVWVDNEDLYEQVLHAVERIAPQMLARVKLYTRPEPIFDAFGITQELEKALRPKVWLKSGGYIVINQTEALVAIDVNTGKYVGKSNRLEDTIVKTNVEAVKEIVRQMRLRDLGGIIVVDFIDMDERKNRTKVMATLEEAMRSDKAPYKILQFNDFGLVAITRKRVKQSLERALCCHCPYCEGAGYVKSVPTVISEILVEATKYSKVVDGKECVLRASPEVAKEMKSTENKYLEEIEEILGRPVLVVADQLLHQEKFDLT